MIFNINNFKNKNFKDIKNQRKKISNYDNLTREAKI